MFINTENVADTTEKMTSFLREEWFPIRRSPTESRESTAFLLRQLILYTYFFRYSLDFYWFDPDDRGMS